MRTWGEATQGQRFCLPDGTQLTVLRQLKHHTRVHIIVPQGRSDTVEVLRHAPINSAARLTEPQSDR